MAVMSTLKRCPDCGEVFVAESPNGKYCACCSAKRNIPAAARGKGYKKMELDPLMLDVRQADAAGLSYGRWRYEETERRRKAEEELHRQIEERKKRRAQKEKEKEKDDGKSKV